MPLCKIHAYGQEDCMVEIFLTDEEYTTVSKVFKVYMQDREKQGLDLSPELAIVNLDQREKEKDNKRKNEIMDGKPLIIPNNRDGGRMAAAYRYMLKNRK